jgi:hypothetical protein
VLSEKYHNTFITGVRTVRFSGGGIKADFLLARDVEAVFGMGIWF